MGPLGTRPLAHKWFKAHFFFCFKRSPNLRKKNTKNKSLNSATTTRPPPTAEPPALSPIVDPSFTTCEQIVKMNNVSKTLFLLRKSKSLHTLSHEPASESLKRKVANFEKKRRTRNLKKTEVFVEVPESRSFLDTATMPMMLTAVGVAVFAKLLMMYDESRSQELIERKVRNAPPGQGTVRMLTREEWEDIREVRPRTPFESMLARPNARLRTGGEVKKEDVKDWGIDVLMDAVTRVEETIRHKSR